MCGITGFTNLDTRLSAGEAQSTISAMTASIKHRGPDNQGAWLSPDASIVLGHRRLSILDLSPAGAQPMTSHCERYTIVLNGEIYNYRDLQKELEAEKGAITFRGHSDTEILLEYIAHFGAQKALTAINGMFALALWDKTENALTLARDRIGQKPLYYGVFGGQLLFASELKAIEQHPALTKTINRGAVSSFLCFGYLPEPYSIWEGLYKLSAGSYVTIPCGGKTIPDISPRPYWSAQETFQNAQTLAHTNPEDAKNALKETLRRSVSRCMVSDVPVGAFLSGGIDSSLIVSMMQERSTQKIKTFTMGFEEPAFNEAEYAKDVANHIGTEHTEMIVKAQDVLDVIPSLSGIYDEPFADMSALPTNLLCKMTGEHVKVALSGDGADELFGGYTRYYIAERMKKAFEKTPAFLRSAAAGLLKNLPNSHKAERLAHILQSQNPQDIYSNLLTHEVWAKDLVIPDPASVAAMASVTHADNMDFLSYMQLYDVVNYLPGDIFTKIDRASMAVSLETRTPFLDNEVIDFAATLPRAMKYQDKQGKWLLRQVLYDYMPKHLIERPKKGFDLPLAALLRGPLKDWAADLIACTKSNSHDILNADAVQKIWNEHISGKKDHQYLLWNILVLQTWLNKQ